MNDQFKTIRNLVREGDARSALSRLLTSSVILSSRFHNEVILHLSRLNQLLSDNRKGIVDYQQFTKENNKINNAILELIDECEKEGLILNDLNKVLDRSDVLLITVTDIELKEAISEIEQNCACKSLITYHNNITYYDFGEINGARIRMVQSDMGAGGPGGASLTIRDAIEHLLPSSIIMIGIAFGVNPDKQSVGDILVSRRLMNYELQRVGTNSDGDMLIIPRGDRPLASVRLLDRFRSGIIDWQGANVDFGLILSGPKLVDNIDYRKWLQELEPEAIGGEMEGSGLYDAAYRSKSDWIIVKAICDWADGEKHENKSQRQKEAAQNAARFVVHVLSRGGFT